MSVRYFTPFIQVTCALALSTGVYSAAFAQAASQQSSVTFAINEGVSYKNAEADTRERYKDIAADLSKLLKRPVNVVPVMDYKKLSTDLASAKYEIAYIHPAHLSIAAIKTTKYSLLALTKGYTDYRASFIVAANSPIKTLQDLKNPQIKDKATIAPAEDSITSVIARATLLELNGSLPAMSYTQFQDAVPFTLEHGLAAMGVSASASVVKAWQAKGGRVIGLSKPVPIKHLIASASLSDVQRAEVADYFIKLSTTEQGRKRLQKIGLEGFTPFDEKALISIGKWLGV
jgi:phosphonate transport system substrate-binding protein